MAVPPYYFRELKMAVFDVNVTMGDQAVSVACKASDHSGISRNLHTRLERSIDACH